MLGKAKHATNKKSCLNNTNNYKYCQFVGPHQPSLPLDHPDNPRMSLDNPWIEDSAATSTLEERLTGH